MIRIKIVKRDNKILNIKIKGHAGYAESGKDIVCSAVSSMVITTINNILSLSDNIDYNKDKSGLMINVIKIDDVNQKLLNNMISMLKELESDYSKYIKITEEV